MSIPPAPESAADGVASLIELANASRRSGRPRGLVSTPPVRVRPRHANRYPFQPPVSSLSRTALSARCAPLATTAPQSARSTIHLRRRQPREPSHPRPTRRPRATTARAFLPSAIDHLTHRQPTTSRPTHTPVDSGIHDTTPPITTQPTSARHEPHPPAPTTRRPTAPPRRRERPSPSRMPITPSIEQPPTHNRPVPPGAGDGRRHYLGHRA